MIVAEQWRPLQGPVELGYMESDETLVRFHGMGDGRPLEFYSLVTDEDRYPFVASMFAEGMLVEVRKAPKEE